MLPKRSYFWFSFLLLLLFHSYTASEVHPSETDTEKKFLAILSGAYRVSCNSVESLRDYYLSDAEIIHDGRQMALDEIIKELKESAASLSGLVCTYEPKVRSIRVSEDFVYLVVRETIRLSAREMGDQEIQQLCTYIFMRMGSVWKISHDHCSSIPGLTV